MKDMITIHGLSAVTITSTDDARNARDKTLAHAATVLTVGDNDAAIHAGDALKEIKALTRLIETSRNEVKAPILEQGRKIDALAKELTADLDAEASRISAVLGVWTAEQKRQEEIALRKVQEEATRLVAIKRAEQEARDEQERAEEQERFRARAAAGPTPEQIAKNKEEDEQREIAAGKAQEKRDLEMQQQIVALKQTAIASVGPRPSGISTRKVVKFEVFDAVALFYSAPFLITLTPNNAAISSAVKGLSGTQTLAGVRHWTEQVAIVR